MVIVQSWSPVRRPPPGTGVRGTLCPFGPEGTAPLPSRPVAGSPSPQWAALRIRAIAKDAEDFGLVLANCEVCRLYGLDGWERDGSHDSPGEAARRSVCVSASTYRDVAVDETPSSGPVVPWDGGLNPHTIVPWITSVPHTSQSPALGG